jgi:hypothetical protein
MSLSLVAALLMLLAADLFLHHRAERSAGLNRYGYRGPVVGRKQPGEIRVVMLGGSTVFGYGVAWDESISVYLEAQLRERLPRPVTVVNLGFNNEGAHAFVPNLEDFEYLDYDLVVLYEGYNDLLGDDGVNRAVYRRGSAVYRWTGYYPILPLYLDEKAMMMRSGGDLNAAYDDARRKEHGQAVVFKANLAQRTSAAAIEAVAAMTRALDGQLANTATIPAPAMRESESTLGCTYPYVTFCGSVAAAVRFGLERGKGVVVGSQPRSPGEKSLERHARQQEMLARMLARNFGGDTRVVWADFSRLVDLHGIDVTFDGMHLKPEANAIVAAAFVEPVLSAAAGAGIQ